MEQTLLKTWLMLVCLIVGVGTTWAETKTEGFEAATTGTSYQSTVNVDASKSDCSIAWTIYYGNVTTTNAITGNNSVGLRLYTSNNYGYLESKTAVENLSSISFDAKAATSNSAKIKFNVQTSTDGSSWTNVATDVAPGTSSSNYTYSVTSGHKFVKISISSNSTKPSKSSAQLTIDNFKFTYSSGGGSSDPVEASWSVDPTSVSVKATKTATATITTNYNGTLSVSSANPDVATATIDGKVITVTGVAEGNTTLTVSGAATSAYKAISKTIDVAVTANVRPANEIFYESFDTNDGTGGNDDLWSGSIASNNIKQDNEGWVYENEAGAKECAKFGASSKLGTATTPALGQACNATLTFKAAAWNGNSESTTLKLSVVGGGSISPATVTMTKGAWNTFEATLTNLTADSKIKFEGNAASNSRFFLDEVSIVKASDVTPDPEKTLVSIAVTGTPAELWKGDAFNHNGMTVTATWSDESTTDVTSSCTFSGYDMTTAGQQTVTVTYLEKTCQYDIEVKTIANTAETAYTTAEAKTLIDAGKDLATEVYVTGIVSKVDSYNQTYHSITYWLDGNSFEIYGGLAKEGEEFRGKYDIEVGAEVVVKGIITKYNSTYEMDKNGHLVSYKAPALSVTFKEAGFGYSTLYSDKALVIPEGVEAYTLTKNETTGNLTPTLIEEVIPAKTGVMLMAENDGWEEGEKTYSFAYTTTENTVDTDLQGVTVETNASGNEYVLSVVEGKVGFYKYAGAKLAANKAYYVSDSGVKGFYVDFGGEPTTGIYKNERENENRVAFDLSGRRINASAKGISIVAGKKVIK